MSENVTIHIHQTSTKLTGAALPRLLEGFQKAVLGRRITGAGYADLGGEPTPVLMLDNGETIFASRDDEGNGPGVLTLGQTDAVLCETSFR